jgi:monomeric sarcosine oxidase
VTSYDAIVLGSGGAGSAALYHLALRGACVLGLDRFPPGHDRGSSHGETRIIRLAYFEHSHYVPLLRRAYALWRELEARRGEALYRETGLVQVGPASGQVVEGVLRSAREHALEVEELAAADVKRRFPGLHVPEGMQAVYERGAGCLAVEACVRAHAAEAVRLGAEIRSGEEVRSWQPDGRGFAVETDRGHYRAQNLVVTAGPWAKELLADLGLRLEVRRKPLFWFRCDDPRYAASRGFPAFLFELPEGVFYGFPSLDGQSLKAAEHSGGAVVSDPLAVSRAVDPADEARVAGFLARCLPGVGRERVDHAVCMYTMTPDEHFVVDRHPEHPHLAFAAGLSGHGFKFTCVLGEVLAQLILDGRTEHPVGFLSLARPGLR